MRGTILLMEVQEEIAALLRDAADLPPDEIFEAVRTEEGLARLEQEDRRIDALVLGTSLAEPMRLAQRAHALDRHLSVLVLSPPEQYPQLLHALRFTPFIGPEVNCWPTAPAEKLQRALQEGVLATRQKRRFQNVITAVNRQLATAPSPQPEPIQYLDRLLDYAPIGIVTLDQEGRIHTWNSRATRILGRSERAALGTSLVDFLPQRERRKFKQFIGQVARAERGSSNAIFERDVGAPQSQYIEMTAAPLRSGSGKRDVMLLFQDVTDRVLAEKAREEVRHHMAFLAEASARLASSLDFDTILTTIAHLVVPELADHCLVDISEEEGRLRRVELVREGLLPGPPEEERERPYSLDLTLEGHPAARALREGSAILIPTVTDEQLGLIARDAEHHERLRQLHPTSGLVVPLMGYERPLGIISMGLVGAERRFGPDELALAEELARRAAVALENARHYRTAQAAIRVRDEFLSVASHELKTPVTNIKGYADLLQRRVAREGDMAPHHQRAINVIQEESQRLSRLIDQLLDISRLQSGRFTIERAPVELCALLERIVETARVAHEQHPVELLCSDDSLVIEGDELRLEQVFQNLIINAAKYSPAGSRIRIQLERAESRVRLSVSDQGIGIPAEALPHLFHQTYRADNARMLGIGGMGMGLYIVGQIVEAHGGTIQVSSSQGAGSIFTIELPLQAPPAG